MAENPWVNKVEVSDGTVLMDLTQDTITSEHMLAGTTAHAHSGASISGSIPTYTGEFVVTTTSND